MHRFHDEWFVLTEGSHNNNKRDSYTFEGKQNKKIFCISSESAYLIHIYLNLHFNDTCAWMFYGHIACIIIIFIIAFVVQLVNNLCLLIILKHYSNIMYKSICNYTMRVIWNNWTINTWVYFVSYIAGGCGITLTSISSLVVVQKRFNGEHCTSP